MTDQTTGQTATGDDKAASAAAADATAATTGAAADTKTADTKADTGTIADGNDTTATKTVVAPADWPENWRDKLAGGDEAFRKRLDRFASPNDFAKSSRELEKKFSSGERNKLPENATAEQVAQWRKDNGIPDKAEEYVAKLALPNGVVLGETDKPLAASFAEFAHGKNWEPQKFNEALEWYTDFQAKQLAEQSDRDATFKSESVAALQGEWQGADYKRNVTAVKNMMATWPADLRDSVLAARSPDGRKLGDHPAFVKQLASLALDLNPAATLVPGTEGNPTKGINDRIADIEKLMGDRSSDYWRGPKADGMQKEYRELVEARDKLKARAA